MSMRATVAVVAAALVATAASTSTRGPVYDVRPVLTTNSSYYDTFTGMPTSEARVNQLRANNLIPWCALQVRDCNKQEARRMDLSCNNLKHPSRGAMVTPFHRMLPPNYATDGDVSTARSGNPLPNARRLRVALMSDGRVPNTRFTNLMINMVLYIIGDITTVHDTVNYVVATTTCCLPGGDLDPRCIPIYVPEDDVHLRRSNIRCLNLTRSYTYQRIGCVPRTVPGERLNAAAPMLELSFIYGHDEVGARKAREFSGGRLRADNIRGKDWPPDGSPVCINNQPPNETRCHDAAVSGINGLMGLNIVSMWLFRQHNHLARKLEAINPCWDDDQLYYTAREINIATVVQILYYELMPQIIGHDYLKSKGVIYPGALHVDDYDGSLEPRVSIEYMVTNRWFHTLQEGRVYLYDRNGKYYDQLLTVDLILRTGILRVNNTMEGMTQGTFRQPCAADDYTIDPDMGERVLGRLQQASDVLSSDIMKGRDMGFQPYNHYRKLCGLPVAESFHDLYKWMPVDQVNAIRMNYESVDDVELMIGIISERRMPDAVMGPTLACIMTDQLLRWRKADRFWYEHPNRPMALTEEQLKQIRRATMARLVCDHGDQVDEIQPYPFLLSGPRNPITDCRQHESMSLEPWRDPTCAKEKQKSNTYEEYQNSDKAYANRIPDKPYASQILDKSYASQIPDKSYANRIPDKLYASQILDKPYASQIPDKSYASQIPDIPYASQIPDKSYESQIPGIPYASQIPDKSYASQIPDKSYANHIPGNPYASSYLFQ